MVVKGFTDVVQEVVETIFAFEPLAPELELVRGDPSDISDAGTRKGDEILSGAWSHGDLSDPFPDQRHDQLSSRGSVALVQFIHQTLILRLRSSLGTGGEHCSSLNLESDVFQVTGADPELGVEQGGHGRVVQLPIGDPLRYVRRDLAKSGDEMNTDQGECTGQ